MPNVKLASAGKAGVLLETGELAVATIALASWNGTEATDAVMTVTDRRILRDAVELIRWVDVLQYHWIDRDITKWGELKATRFQRIILDARDGRAVVLDGLGQAAFPLLEFLRWWTKQRPKQALLDEYAADGM